MFLVSSTQTRLLFSVFFSQRMLFQRHSVDFFSKRESTFPGLTNFFHSGSRKSGKVRRPLDKKETSFFSFHLICEKRLSLQNVFLPFKLLDNKEKRKKVFLRPQIRLKFSRRHVEALQGDDRDDCDAQERHQHVGC